MEKITAENLKDLHKCERCYNHTFDKYCDDCKQELIRDITTDINISVENAKIKLEEALAVSPKDSILSMLKSCDIAIKKINEKK